MIPSSPQESKTSVTIKSSHSKFPLILASDAKEMLSELEQLLPKEKLTADSPIPPKKDSTSSIPTITITAPSANNTPKFENYLQKPPQTNGAPKAPPKKLIEGEAVETGQVKFKIYWIYIRSIGLFCITVFLIAYVFSSALGILSNMWLAHWSDSAVKMAKNASQVDDMALNLGIYTLLGLGQALAVCIAAVWVSLGMVKASKLLHSNMLDGIMAKPMWFFDTTPMGRILNRFSKDLDMIDSRLPSSVLNFTGSIIQALAILCVPIIITPQVTPSIVIILVVYCFLTVFYLSTSRQLKRLEAVTRSPIYSHFAESINGSSSIRAFNCEQRFVQRSQQLIDENIKAYYPSLVANRWLSVRLELIGNLIVFFSGIFAVIFSDYGVTAGLIGLSVSYAFNVTQTLNWAVRMSSELETNIVSVERVTEYAEEMQDDSESPLGLSIEPLSGWPTNGQITFEEASFSYRPESQTILNNISINIKAKEKIAIVGRTGSGKSSFALALFRLLELKSGRVLIDNVDLSTVPLPTLRRRLTIVPQDPVLFSGTLRMNLDPSKRFDEDFLWEALEFAGMGQFVQSLPSGLDTEMTEGGSNISVGQRQLICLARALLRKPKILILDEASASVDLETDQMVHRTLRDHFNDCTVLTIAHRLNWLSDVDRVLVIDNGAVAEFDTPDNLLAQEESLFKALAKEGDFAMRSHKPSIERMTPPRVEITPAEAEEEETDLPNEEEPLLDDAVDNESVGSN
uniref:ABC-type glutathione-S-conjugate transporter n=2 Tax=Bursaphelenchus xylophilus TaxID=6326 RepID=A0A1I7SBP4_BURXY